MRSCFPDPQSFPGPWPFGALVVEIFIWFLQLIEQTSGSRSRGGKIMKLGTGQLGPTPNTSASLGKSLTLYKPVSEYENQKVTAL